MDWFERLVGFRESDYAATRSRLEVVGTQLRSRVNGKSYGIGELELVSLGTLRERVQAAGGLPGRLTASVVTGDVGRLHQMPAFAGALFQVASQFNLLEMIGPDVTPEQGVSRYAGDPTQGPACAIAAGAATIYRNYFVPVGAQLGQTATHQLDGLAELGAGLAHRLGLPIEALWVMRNGYAQCTRSGLQAITGHLAALDSGQRDALRERLQIGIHRDVEVTQASDGEAAHRPVVSQAFCSALPVAYGPAVPKDDWMALASLVLEAAYEATLWAAVANAQRGVSNLVLLTQLGGGAFGNEDAWIHAALRRALARLEDYALDVRLVSYGAPSPALLDLVQEANVPRP